MHESASRVCGFPSLRSNQGARKHLLLSLFHLFESKSSSKVSLEDQPLWMTYVLSGYFECLAAWFDDADGEKLSGSRI